MRRYCCHTVSEDRLRVFEFLRDLIAYRVWRERDSRPKSALLKDDRVSYAADDAHRMQLRGFVAAARAARGTDRETDGRINRHVLVNI